MFVSPGDFNPGTGNGSIYKRFYSWLGGQVKQTAPCLLSPTTARVENYGYGHMVRFPPDTFGFLGGALVGPAGPIISGSATGFVQATNAKCVSQLKGPNASFGGSAGEVVTVGGDIVGGQGYNGKDTYVGGDINVGVGGGFPLEGHALVGVSGGWDNVTGWSP